MKVRVAEIVAAYVGHNTISADQLPALIASVSDALSRLGKKPPIEEEPIPAISIRRSVSPNTLICLECGYSGVMLKRHIFAAHGMIPEEYRSRWNLPPDYPMVAKNYASQRSELAKAMGLGTRPSARRLKSSRSRQS
jgi:predicted transcriptional regulator